MTAEELPLYRKKVTDGNCIKRNQKLANLFYADRLQKNINRKNAKRVEEFRHSPIEISQNLLGIGSRNTYNGDGARMTRQENSNVNVHNLEKTHKMYKEWEKRHKKPDTGRKTNL